MDRRGLEQLVAACYPAARRLALLVCKDPHTAEDLVQDAVLRAIRRPPKPLNEPILHAWLRTTIMRLFLSRQRRLGREARALRRLPHEIPAEIEPVGPSGELLAALRALSPKQRACVVLRYLEDLSEQDVAAVLGVEHGTVKAHLATARARLRSALRETADLP